MREKERGGNYSSTLGEAGQKFCWTIKRPPRVRTHLSDLLNSQASSFPVWIPEALDCHEDPQIRFILSPNTPQQLQS